MRIIRKNTFLFMVFATCMCASRLTPAPNLNDASRYKKSNSQYKTKSVSNNNHAAISYLPYLEVGGTRFSSGESRTGVGADLFVPLWQSANDLIFSDLRFYDRTGRPFEGNIHLGYRHLVPDKEYMIGVYGAFDRKRSESGNYFNQITVGGEYWLKSLFLGANFYQPIGDSSKPASIDQSAEFDKTYRNIWVTTDKKNENAMQGCDAELGYEFVKGFAWYVGGYYFNEKNTDTIYGPRARIAYDWSLENGKRIAGVFDKLGLEFGVQRDKPRGTIWYANAKVRVGLMSNNGANLEGVARHMVDLIHRDVDIVSSKTSSQKREVHKENGKVVYIEKSDNGLDSIEDKGNARIKRVTKGEHIILSDLGRTLKVDVGHVFKVEKPKKEFIPNSADSSPIKIEQIIINPRDNAASRDIKEPELKEESKLEEQPVQPKEEVNIASANEQVDELDETPSVDKMSPKELKKSLREKADDIEVPLPVSSSELVVLHQDNVVRADNESVNRFGDIKDVRKMADNIETTPFASSEKVMILNEEEVVDVGRTRGGDADARFTNEDPAGTKKFVERRDLRRLADMA